MANEEIDTDLLFDRLVSASNSEDAETALNQILEALPVVISEDTVWSALISIFHDGSFRNLLVPDGKTTAGRILLELLKSGTTTSDTLLEVPGRVLESCIDVACSRETAVYPRIIAMQILQILSRQGKLAQSQWLAAPNGLHRIADLLRDDSELQTETLSLAQILAQWSAVAKLWMFAEMGDVVMQTALAQGGLTGGSVTVLECLELLRALVSHDAALADLVVAESPVVVPGLCQLLDLRAAQAFRFPEKAAGAADDEDLDALLSSKSDQHIVPYLLEAEEKCIRCVLNILGTVLENESLKETVWQQHKALGAFIWDMALLVPPPPNQPAFCGVPSVELRVSALETAARYFHYSEEPQARGGWDRLLGAICTSEDPRLSHGALSLLRRTCTEAAANEILLQGLAPTMDGDSQQHATVVHKLLNTILEQLNKEEEQRPVLVVGALFALSVFLTDDARRSILYKISAMDGKESTLLMAIFAYLERAAESTKKTDPYITWHVWRFLAVWMQQAPVVVQAVLNSPHQPLLVNTGHPVARLCLGMTVLYGGDDDLCGGWTRSSLLQAAQPWSRWTASLETLKTTDSYEENIHSKDEIAVWKEWVTPAVLEIRQAIVQEMTSAAEKNDDDEMGRVVREQQEDVERLRTSLQDAQRRVTAQDNELETWRRRVESNPTQLDQLLNDSTSKISSLEQTIAALRTEKEEQTAAHKQALEERDQQLASVQQQLADAQTLEAEANTERDVLRDEMSALSQAYNSLEQEYRAQQETASRSTEEHQQEGEESAQSSAEASTDVTTLRAEITRLRGDVKSAEEWMAMAYERMNELGTQNDSLQQQLANTPASDSVPLANPPNPDTESLQSELGALRAEIERRKQEAKNEIAQRDERISELENKDDEMQRLRTDNEAAQQWMSQAVEHHQILTEQVNVLSEQNTDLKARLNSSPDDNHDDEVIRLKEEIEAYRLHKESMADVDNELQSTRGTLEALRAELVVKDQELQLLTSNISRADSVADELLQEQISNLRRKLQQGEEVAVQNRADLSESVERISALENALAERQAEAESRLSEIESLTQELTQARSSLPTGAQTTETSSRIQRLEEERAQLETQLQLQKEEAESVIFQWQESYSALESHKAGMEVELERYVQAIERTEQELQECKVARDEMQFQLDQIGGDLVQSLRDEVKNLKEQLADQEQDASHTISQWQETHQELERKFGEVSEDRTKASSELEIAERELERLGTENSKLSDQNSDLHSVIEEMRSSMEKLQETSVTSSTVVETSNISLLERTIDNLREQLQDQTDEARQESIQWEESYAALAEELEQSKAASAHVEDKLNRVKAEADQLRVDLEEAATEFRTQLADLEQSCKTKDIELQSLHHDLAASRNIGQDTIENESNECLLAKVALLERQLIEEQKPAHNGRDSIVEDLRDRLQDQVEEAKQESMLWEESYSAQTAELEVYKAAADEAEKNLNLVKSEADQLRDDLEEATIKFESELGDLKLKYQAKEMELEALHQESAASEKVGQSTSENECNESLLSKVAFLERQLLQEQTSAQTVLGQWETSYYEIAGQLDAANEKLNSSAYTTGQDATKAVDDLVPAAEKITLNKDIKRLNEDFQAQAIEGTTKIGALEATIISLQEKLADEQASLQEKLADEQASTASLVLDWERSYNDIAYQLQVANEKLLNQKHGELVDPSDNSDIVKHVKQQLEERENELNIARQTLSNYERESWQQTAGNREVELQDTIENLESQLAEQDRSSKELLRQWEESYNGVVAQLDEAHETLQQSHEAAASATRASESEAKSLKEEVVELQGQLLQREQEMCAIRDSQSGNDERHQAERMTLESQLGELKDNVVALESQIAEEQASSYQIVSEWEASYSALEAQFNDTSKELEQLKIQFDDAKEVVEEEPGVERDVSLKANDGQGETELVTQLRVELEERENELITVRESLKSHERGIAEPTTEDVSGADKIAALEAQIADEQTYAKEMLAQWEESYYDVSGQLDEANEQLMRLTTPGNEELTANSASLELELQQCRDLIRQWQESYTNLESQLADVTNKRGQMSAGVGPTENSEYTVNSIGIGQTEELTKLTRQLQNLQSESREELSEWERKYQELELAATQQQVTELQQKFDDNAASTLLHSQLSEAKAVAVNLEATCKELESQLSGARDDAAAAEAQISSLAASLQECKELHQSTVAEISDQLEKTRSELHIARESEQVTDAQSAEPDAQVAELNKQLLEERDINVQWADSYNHVAYQLEKANEKIQEMSSNLPTQEIAETQAGEPSDSNPSNHRSAEEEHETAESLQAQLDQAKEIVSEWEQSYLSQETELQQSLDSLTQVTAKIQALEENMSRSTADFEESLREKDAEIEASVAERERIQDEIREIVREETDTVDGESTNDALEDPDSLVSALRTRLHTQKDLVSQWESCYYDLESQLREAIAAKKTLQTEIVVAQAALSVFENQEEDCSISHETRDKVSEEKEQDLLQKLESLEAQLLEEQKEASDIVEQWQTSYEELELQLVAAGNELAQLHNGAAPSDDPNTDVPGHGEATEESATELARLEAELEESRQSSKTAIKKWEDEFSKFQKEAQEVIAQWRDENETIGRQLEQSLEQNELNRGQIEDLRSQLELAQKQIESDMADHELDSREQTSTLQQLKADLEAAQRERIAAQDEASELRDAIKSRENQVEELKNKLADNSRRTSDLQSQAIESYVGEYLETIKRLEREVTLEKNEKRLVEDKLTQMDEQFKAQVEALKSESALASQTIKADITVYREKLDIAEETLRSIRNEKAGMEHELTTLKSRNEELVDEVQEATAALQISASERASERASDVAVSILKRQIEELHAQLEEDQRALANEHKALEDSEAEASRLRANLTALLGLENTEENRSFIEQKLVEATESFQRSERAEILTLKKSLERALKDLSAARLSEKEKEEVAAKANYQASLFEQELFNTKSDFQFLAQSMDEIREAEESKKASLEYRLSTVLNEQTVERKCHSVEVETLRNELSQINMERDRLLQALKDSEKNREVVMQASARDRKHGDDSDTYEALARLRVEKAQLLATASEEAARAERKLRETREASRAAAEADIILEKELRMMAEKSLACAKVELEQFRAQAASKSPFGGDSMDDELVALKNELETTKRARSILESEVKTLTEHLSSVKKSSTLNIDRLTEECRKALARASLLERDGRLEAEVIAEVARIQNNKDTDSAVQQQQHFIADDEKKEKSDELLELMNEIQNQKQECEKERSMYFNVLAEHDDMLAMIAQQDILTSSLKEALSQQAGQESLDRAIKEAEGKVKDKYGKFVKLS